MTLRNLLSKLIATKLCRNSLHLLCKRTSTDEQIDSVRENRILARVLLLSIFDPDWLHSGKASARVHKHRVRTSPIHFARPSVSYKLCAAFE